MIVEIWNWIYQIWIIEWWWTRPRSHRAIYSGENTPNFGTLAGVIISIFDCFESAHGIWKLRQLALLILWTVKNILALKFRPQIHAFDLLCSVWNSRVKYVLERRVSPGFFEQEKNTSLTSLTSFEIRKYWRLEGKYLIC